MAALDDCLVTEVEDTLDFFPRGLDGVNARILLQIVQRRREIAAKLLRWTVMAVRLLKLSEIGALLADAKKPAAFSLDRDEAVRSQVSYCGYFLTIKNDEIGLIHQSAKDYLLRQATDSNPVLEAFRVKSYETHVEIATTCFDYLQNGSFANGVFVHDHARIEAFPLLSYAAFNWPEHAKFLLRTERIFDLSLPFYQRDSQVRISWLFSYSFENGLFEAGFSLGIEDLYSFPLLHMACFWDILPLAENLLLLHADLLNEAERFSYIHQRDELGNTALRLAACQGYTGIVQLFLDKGASINATGSKPSSYKRPLYEAASRGHVSVVQLLLDRKDGVNERRVAILEAAKCGNVNVITSILDIKGTAIGGQDLTSTLGVATQYAAKYGEESTVRLLLDRGAEVDGVPDSYGPLALRSAAKRGHRAIVQLLLDYGTDPNFNFNENHHDLCPVLHEAVNSENESVVRLLIDHGADIEARHNGIDSKNLTPLLFAAEICCANVLALLLGRGADVNALDSDGGFTWQRVVISAMVTPLFLNQHTRTRQGLAGKWCDCY